MEGRKRFGKQRKESVWTGMEENDNLMEGNAVEVNERGSEGRSVGVLEGLTVERRKGEGMIKYGKEKKGISYHRSV
jgi:hypothetical protein